MNLELILGNTKNEDRAQPGAEPNDPTHGPRQLRAYLTFNVRENMKTSIRLAKFLSSLRILAVIVALVIAICIILGASERLVDMACASLSPAEIIISISLIFTLVSDSSHRAAYVFPSIFFIGPFSLILLAAEIFGFFAAGPLLLFIIWPVRILFLLVIVCLDFHLLRQPSEKWALAAKIDFRNQLNPSA